MAIVKYKNQSGNTYAYESTPEWDPVKKQSRPKRKYLGRVDEETGEIIPTAGKRGRPRKNPVPEEAPMQYIATDTAVAELAQSLAQAKELIEELSGENVRLQGENKRLKEVLTTIYQQAASAIKQ